jgi:hypothetical protein
MSKLVQCGRRPQANPRNCSYQDETDLTFPTRMQGICCVRAQRCTVSSATLSSSASSVTVSDSVFSLNTLTIDMLCTPLRLFGRVSPLLGRCVVQKSLGLSGCVSGHPHSRIHHILRPTSQGRTYREPHHQHRGRSLASNPEAVQALGFRG